MEARKEGKKTQFQQPFNTLLATKALVTMSVLFFLDLPRSISNAGISVQAEPSNITLAAAVGAQWPKIENTNLVKVLKGVKNWYYSNQLFKNVSIYSKL